MNTIIERKPMDRPNGDLKIGDVFKITAWCGEMEMYTPSGFALMWGAERDDGEPKKRPVDGTVFKVLAIDYPQILVRGYCASGHQGQRELDMRTFEARIANPEYAKELIREATPKPQHTCTWCRVKAWWRNRGYED